MRPPLVSSLPPTMRSSATGESCWLTNTANFFSSSRKNLSRFPSLYKAHKLGVIRAVLAGGRLTRVSGGQARRSCSRHVGGGVPVGCHLRLLGTISPILILPQSFSSSKR